MDFQFGKVYTAAYSNDKGESTLVAVKLLRVNCSNTDREEFLSESELMLLLDHPSIVKVIGVCFSRKPWLLVTELMMHKDLGVLLQLCKKQKFKLRIHEMLGFAAQISEAMTFVASVCHK